ncbi:MAG TPA: methyltransferase domain-containing protein [Methanosarcina sp.]|jgi:ubiquinone/menaquinone biosynthesis C-methylase UbiE|nr:methyltransferase domain-containing protein [Methanosarcina sp.]
MEYKKQAVKRWTESAGGYNNTIQAELANEKRRIWTELLLDNAPRKENLRVLDVGTGPGFFSILLSARGHQVTGIDCTPEMLEQAKNNARQEGVNPEFLFMDNHYLEFPENTFDLVVSRNVTWTLYDPQTAYIEWKRVLKPGGRLLIFDANWYMQHFDPEIDKTMRRGILQYREKYGQLPSKFAMHRIEEYWKRLPLVGIKRPLWDRAMLWKLGFQDIVYDDISSLTALDDISQMLYGAITMFMIRATKVTQKEEDFQNIAEYWDGRSPEQSITCLSELTSPHRETYLKLLSTYMPEGRKLRVLDVGTGCGFLAILLAKEGHEITGVDISPLMLEEAAYCANAHKVIVDFRLSNAEKLPFEDDSFDLIISRNLIWTLQNPEKAFSEWYRILKPKGMLIYLDANFYLHLFDPQQKGQFEKFRQTAGEHEITPLYGTGHSSTSVMDSIALRLPLSAQKRPEWDKKTLSQVGFQVISIEQCISKLLGKGEEQIQYAATPMFFIVAQKNSDRR